MDSIKTGDEIRYPNLAKRESDGIYCYHAQRRISCRITRYCVQWGLTANGATFIDFLLALSGALFIYLGFPIVGLLLVQLFGIFSCVDGEIARLTGKTNKLGDFYDTMVDRVAEFLFIGALFLYVQKAAPDYPWGGWFFAYLGAVFLITVSSEKYRSTFKQNYPKKSVESLFCWISAGSDIRLFYLSITLLWITLSGSVEIVKWLISGMAFSLYINLIFRLWRISRLSGGVG